MNYLSLIDLLSDCGAACVLINTDYTIISINDQADLLLSGEGQLPGQKLPAGLIPLVESLRAKEGKEGSHAPADKAEQVTAGAGTGTTFFREVLPAESTPAAYARIAFGRYAACTALLQHPLLPGDTRLLILRDASRDHALDMAVTALDQIHEAVVICDEEDRMYFCNAAALEIDDLVFEKVRGEHINNVYENEDTSPLSIPQTRQTRTPSLNHRQYYHTRSGQRRETIANFFPVLRGSDTLGAFSVLEDWDTASSLQRKVIDLQDRLLRYEQARAAALPPASGKSADSSETEGILQARHHFEDFVQHSAVARNTVKTCSEAASTDQVILLYGENGTGKHFLAQSMHLASRRSTRPFLQFNCASLPQVLLEEMLFGTVRGAYPEAEDKKGLLEQAEDGTLYLSDLDAMPLPLQHRLLHAVQRGVFSRISDDRPVRLNARLILSTSFSPDKAIELHKLDPALYSILQHHCIMVPPLRNRRADIIPLTLEFVNSCNRKYKRQIVTVSDNVFSLFRKYRWPGNIKELKQAIEHAIRRLPEDAELLTSEYLPARISHIKKAAVTAAPTAAADAVVLSRPADNVALKDTVNEIRRQSIYQILLKNNGNITKAAAEMGLSRQNLQYHIRQCGIDLQEIRAAARK